MIHLDHKLTAPNGSTFLASDIALGMPDYAGRYYSRFEPRRQTIGTGWAVIGYADNVSATVIASAARPDRPYRRTPRFNGKVPMGWKRRSDAQHIADYLNASLSN